MAADHDTLTQAQAVQQALDAIAPVWPLDRFIAVNPWWEMTNRPLEQCSAELAALQQAQCLMPRDYYRECWERGDIIETHLHQAAEMQGVSADTDALLQHLSAPRKQDSVVLPSDVLDQARDLLHQTAWRDEIEHQISQSCAAYFDDGLSTWRPTEGKDLYQHWLSIVRQDRGMGLLMDSAGLHKAFQALPDDAEALIAEALNELELTPAQSETFCHAQLRRIQGWSAWCAYQAWQAKLAGSEDDSLRQLLAVGMAWELVLVRLYDSEELRRQWQRRRSQWPDLPRLHACDQQWDWVWQTALELAYQWNLADTLQAPQAETAQASPAPTLQAAFCIDVRSEVYRRALEAQDRSIQTLGFAGFFGLPLAYQAAGSADCRPQLPGLLAPALTVTEQGGQVQTMSQRRGRGFDRHTRWQAITGAAPGVFNFVEAGGWLYGLKLLKQSFFGSGEQHPVNALGEAEGPAPALAIGDGEGGLPVDQAVDMAHHVLKGMSLTQDFAPLVLLVGHGSASRNNPHAAGLDCGACGGQTGEVNARVLAGLLNDARIRSGLAARGVAIPDATVFLPALHNTTTDEVTVFDRQAYLGEDHDRLAAAEAWLEAASEAARAMRAELLPSVTGADLKDHRRRAADWSQVRPEWGLANNASLIIAPRARLRGKDLQGRSFLHEYDWRQDEDFAVLTQILTAPMVVAHWINLQYYASVTDNAHYGSGNKVLHNVVGGHIGVFEGNGGDLRTGLPMQSLHDGERWVHTPLRLSVFVDAPQAAIAGIVAAHPHIKQLIDNRWLYLFSMSQPVRRHYQGAWEVYPTMPSPLGNFVTAK